MSGIFSYLYDAAANIITNSILPLIFSQASPPVAEPHRRAGDPYPEEIITAVSSASLASMQAAAASSNTQLASGSFSAASSSLSAAAVSDVAASSLASLSEAQEKSSTKKKSKLDWGENCRYEGRIVNFKADGEGLFIFAPKDPRHYFIGTFEDGYFKEGTLQYKNGSCYKWKKDTYQGNFQLILLKQNQDTTVMICAPMLEEE